MEGLVTIRNAGDCISSPDLFRFLEEHARGWVTNVDLTAAKLYGYMNTRKYPNFTDSGRKTLFKISDFIEMLEEKGQDSVAFEYIANVVSREYDDVPEDCEEDECCGGSCHSEDKEVEEAPAYDRNQALTNLSNVNVMDKTMLSGVEIDGVFYVMIHDVYGNFKNAFEIPSPALAMAQESERAKTIVAGMVAQLSNR